LIEEVPGPDQDAIPEEREWVAPGSACSLVDDPTRPGCLFGTPGRGWSCGALQAANSSSQPPRQNRRGSGGGHYDPQGFDFDDWPARVASIARSIKGE